MFIANLIRYINSWLRYRRNLDELSRLTDRELEDIGMRRGEIESIAWTTARA
jgi:uncharacterized protein YjiS (DUF1127 family)